MSNISRLRDAADLLLNMGKYDEAYDVYDEVYCQIWSALGSVQSGLSEFSFGFLTHNIRPAIEFKNRFMEPAVNTIFLKWFNLDIDQTLNEFIFSTYGHLQCICMSQTLLAKFTSSTILNEFLVLYSLIIHSTDDKWITYLLKVVTPVIDGNRLKKIRSNYPDEAVNKLLLQSVEKIKSTDWNSVNHIILDYINKSGERDSDFSHSLQGLVGENPNQSKHRSRKNDKRNSGAGHKKSSQEHYEQHEKYERYEKYEKYERFEKARTQNQKDFDSTGSSEEEKIKHYGSLLGLRGRVTKSDIRKKYLEAIAKYHPDKVQNLGEEIIEFAERRTKEINAAYDWLKIKFNL